MKIMKKPNAFTLVELLVVISIIALLAGLALPALNRARREGFKVQDVSNLKQVGLSIKLFANDYDGQFPKNWPMDDDGEDTVAPNSNTAFRALFGTGVLRDERIFYTPGVPFFKKGDNDIGTRPSYSKALERGENSYSYFAGHSEGSESIEPLAWNPTRGGITRDGERGWKASDLIPQIHGGNGIHILRVDGSVSWVPKKADGTVQLGGTEDSFQLDIKALSPQL